MVSSKETDKPSFVSMSFDFVNKTRLISNKPPLYQAPSLECTNLNKAHRGLTLLYPGSLGQTTARGGKKCPPIISKTIISMSFQLRTIVITSIRSLTTESGANWSRGLLPGNQIIGPS